MNKKLRTILMIILVLIGVFVAIDNFLETKIVIRLIDHQGPSIITNQLKDKHLVNRDYDYSGIYCEDNFDKVCEITIINEINTSILGNQTFKIQAVDDAGNLSEILFSVEVIENIDGSMYIPEGYYDTIDGLEGEVLKAALNDIITGHTEYPYTDDETDVWDLLKIIDEDPENPENILLFYSDYSWYKDCQDTTSPPDLCEMEIEGELKTIEWNREHVWSKSRGDFEIKDGTTTVLAMGAHTDLHHLVAEERTKNSIKNNRMFEDCHDGDDTSVEHVGYGNYTCNTWDFEPRDEVKGDVARMLFYMAVRYEGEEGDMVDLELINNPDSDKLSKLPLYGDLDDLLRWHEEDPISEREILRNQLIFTYQNNRNPFVDRPDLVVLIWGRPEDYID